MNRGEIWRTRERSPERGNKPSFYVIVSRQFIAENDDISTVVCAPVYSQILGISTEIVIGAQEGLPKSCAIRCDFLALMFKQKLSTLAGSLSAQRIKDLDRALAVALDLPVAVR